MTSTSLSGERQAFVDAVRDFCRREFGTREQRLALTEGGNHAHHQGVYQKMADLGWLGVNLPSAYGGSDGGVVDLTLFLEHTSYGLAPIAGFSTSIIVGAAYEKFGTEEQKNDVLAGVTRGRVQSISMSEPEAGSDVAGLVCKAERVEGGYLVNGQKTWCSAAHFADNILLVARTAVTGDKHEGLTMLQVPADAEGLVIKGIDTMGGKEVNDLYFTDVFVPEAAVLGEVGQGWTQLMAGLNAERLILAANSLGRARRAFDDTLDYVKQRKQFGRPIGTFQALRHRLADLATELEATSLLVRHTAELVDENPGKLFPREASMAKLKATELSKTVALEGMQMMGGYGYATEYGMEAHLRATVVSTVYGGTSEVQRDIIGKTYGL